MAIFLGMIKSSGPVFHRKTRNIRYWGSNVELFPWRTVNKWFLWTEIFRHPFLQPIETLVRLIFSFWLLISTRLANGGNCMRLSPSSLLYNHQEYRKWRSVSCRWCTKCSTLLSADESGIPQYNCRVCTRASNVGQYVMAISPDVRDFVFCCSDTLGFPEWTLTDVVKAQGCWVEILGPSTLLSAKYRN